MIEDPDPEDPDAPRATAQQDPWHYSIARMVDACTSAGILPFYGPYGDIKDTEGCETQFRAAFLLGCVGAWSLHPVQIEIAKKVFSPDPDEVKFAKKVIEAIPDGRGVHMIDGKMQDDATWKQCKVMVELAEMLAKKDPELAAGRTRPLSRSVRERRVQIPDPGPLQRVRPAGPRLQRQLPRLLRHRDHRALARARRLRRDARGRRRRHGRRRGDACATSRRSGSTRRRSWSSARSALGNTSMTTELAIERADGEVAAEGELRHVFVDRHGNGTAPIPARVRAGLERYST